MTQARRPDIHDMTRELCDSTQHREQYMRKHKPRYHTTTNPPLLVQLKAAATPNPTVEAGTTRPAASKPSAAIDAIDTLTRIDHEAAAWLRHLGQDDPGNTIACVRQLAALAMSQPSHYRRIEHDIRRWWSWARIITRWDLPAWQPHNTCPLCGERGTIRVKINEKLATCVNDTCRETWDEATIGLLAEHIRTENHDTQQAS